jgi:hypothetical protein
MLSIERFEDFNPSWRIDRLHLPEHLLAYRVQNRDAILVEDGEGYLQISAKPGEAETTFRDTLVKAKSYAKTIALDMLLPEDRQDKSDRADTERLLRALVPNERERRSLLNEALAKIDGIRFI